MSWIKKYYYLLLPLIYFPAIFNFFLGDDWYHLLISQANSLKEVSHFFYFNRPFQQATFYRPLSNQLFFFTFQKIFGLNALPYYLFGLVLFGISLYLIHRLSIELWSNKLFPYITVLIYGFSVSNFSRLYYLSAFQEFFLVIFVALALLAHLKKRQILSLLFFVFALLSKETAVVLFPTIILLDWLKSKINPKQYLGYFVILSIYLYLRFFVMQIPQEAAYVWNFSPVKMINTFIWYTLWSVGAPELLIDYIGSGFRPIPRFFTDYSSWWPVIIAPLIALLSLILIFIIKLIKRVDKKLIFFSGFFLIGLSPLLLLPQHKFALEQGLALVGFSMGVAWLMCNLNRRWTVVFMVIYITYNLAMNRLTYTRHYTVSRSIVSERVYRYFKETYPTAPKNSYLFFLNDLPAFGENLEETRQLAYALSYSDFFKVFYKDKSFKVYYEDFGDLPLDKSLKPISVSSFQFFQ